MKKVISHTIEETYALAHDVMEHFDGHFIALSGELGSGKTTFTQGILRACNAEGPYTSPTFTIMKEYDVNVYGYTKIYHIDAYRVTADDMIELGWDEIVQDKTALIIVEWPENISTILPENVKRVSCAFLSENVREYTFIN